MKDKVKERKLIATLEKALGLDKVPDTIVKKPVAIPRITRRKRAVDVTAAKDGLDAFKESLKSSSSSSSSSTSTRNRKIDKRGKYYKDSNREKGSNSRVLIENVTPSTRESATEVDGHDRDHDSDSEDDEPTRIDLILDKR